MVWQAPHMRYSLFKQIYCSYPILFLVYQSQNLYNNKSYRFSKNDILFKKNFPEI